MLSYSFFLFIYKNYTLPFKALNTQAFAKKPIPTVTNPHPEMSLYLKAPIPIKRNPMINIKNVAILNTLFLFNFIIKNLELQNYVKIFVKNSFIKSLYVTFAEFTPFIFKSNSFK